MNLPNIPTDNYYKFITFFGLTISIISMIILITLTKSNENDLNLLRVETIHTKHKSSILQREMNELEKEVDEFRSRNHLTDSIKQTLIYKLSLKRELLDNQVLQSELLTFNLNKITRKYIELVLIFILSVYAIRTGMKIAFEGFAKWKEFQKLSDEKLKLEVDDLKRKLSSEK